MRFVKFVVAAAHVAAAILVADTTAAKVATADCTDPLVAAEYGPVQTMMQRCETASGISLVLPMKNAKKVILCEKCPELLDYKLSKQAPLCNVTISNGEEIRLQAELNRLFTQCDSASSDQKDGSSGSSVAASTTPAPATTTKAPKTKKPKTPAPSPSTSLDSSSQSLSSSSRSTESTDDGSFESVTTRPLLTTDESSISASESQSVSISGNSSSSPIPAPTSGGSSLGLGLTLTVVAGTMLAVS
uniref:Elicitin-like protein n=1 Tax=Globisporangium ultimum (strain ATCC 200006 / CBS 805.95 / DAOM BR144) TaxID=431595 RepID=K3WN85_GLOUD